MGDYEPETLELEKAEDPEEPAEESDGQAEESIFWLVAESTWLDSGLLRKKSFAFEVAESQSPGITVEAEGNSGHELPLTVLEEQPLVFQASEGEGYFELPA